MILGADGEPLGDSALVQLDSGLVVPRVAAEANLNRERRPTCFDFFCGAGGFSLGMEMAGFHVVGACDNDPIAAQTYLVNLGAYPLQMHFIEQEDRDRMERSLQLSMPAVDRKRAKKGKRILAGEHWQSGSNRKNVVPHSTGVGHFWLGDIRKITGKDILKALGMELGELDCVTGGPPCQGFSMAGRRSVMDPRNSLVMEYARLILELKPKTFVMENVPGILSMVTPQGVPVLDAFCLELEAGGYGLADALKRAITTSVGAGAAVSGGRSLRDRQKMGLGDGDDDLVPADDGQLDLLAGAG